MDSDGTCENSQSFSIQKVAHPSGINLQLAAETCDFCPSNSRKFIVYVCMYVCMKKKKKKYVYLT